MPISSPITHSNSAHKSDEVPDGIYMTDRPSSSEDGGKGEEQAKDHLSLHRADIPTCVSVDIASSKNQDSEDQPRGEAGEEHEEDDWEAVADRSADELLSRAISKISVDDSAIQTPKRRGRGRFTYNGQSDSLSDTEFPHYAEVEDVDRNLENTGSSRARSSDVVRSRPMTSASTARRLIAHGMGMKLPSSSSGLEEFKQQEEARKARIIARQNARDDAWGSDEEKR